MRPPVAWVIGSRGLLGSSLRRALLADATPLFEPAERFRWDDPPHLHRQIGDAVGRFAAEAATAGSWEIYWAAGIGTMHSAAGELEAETDAFTQLLSAIRGCAVLRGTDGAIALSSSAGSIYAGCTDFIVTEDSAPAPTTPYAREKLLQEARLLDAAGDLAQLSTLSARISTLYGSSPSAGRRQGLLSHIARCIARGAPVHVFVPLDTMRDYIAAGDAAGLMIAALRRRGAAPEHLTRIVASERSVTISTILQIFRRIAPRPPRVITGATASTAIYNRLIQFQSRSGAGGPQGTGMPLAVGISQLLEAERRRFVAGGRQ